MSILNREIQKYEEETGVDLNALALNRDNKCLEPSGSDEATELPISRTISAQDRRLSLLNF